MVSFIALPCFLLIKTVPIILPDFMQLGKTLSNLPLIVWFFRKLTAKHCFPCILDLACIQFPVDIINRSRSQLQRETFPGIFELSGWTHPKPILNLLHLILLPCRPRYTFCIPMPRGKLEKKDLCGNEYVVEMLGFALISPERGCCVYIYETYLFGVRLPRL